MRARLLTLALCLFGCPGGDGADDGGVTDEDRDGDGVDDDLDCAPDNDEIFPGSKDRCDLVDNDCDGVVDEDAERQTLHRDQDADGYGDPTWTTEACVAEAGWVLDESDCGPSDPSIYPGAPEQCDGEDHDCDGLVMEDGDEGEDTSTDLSSWWADDDSDGYGAGEVILACQSPVGAVGNGDDCDDTRSDVSPRAPEVCDDADTDEDCDGLVDDLDTWVAGGGSWYPDLDGDGWGDASATPVWTCDAPQDHVAPSEDCDDGDSLVFPGATETCNEIDDDCDDEIDDDPADDFVWYADRDADGYGDSSTFTAACTEPDGYSALAGDCDDANNTRYPSAPETDCESEVDSNCDGLAGTVDTDGDSYMACEECNDADADVFPGAEEVCNGGDDDCDGTVDVGATDALTWYADADADGFGDPDVVSEECSRPVGYVADSSDCDDAQHSTYPGAPETCATDDDDDCNGVADEVDAIACTDFYEDSDDDGFGEDSTCRCDASGDYDQTVGDDCDDEDDESYPGAVDLCGDSVDQDCDGADAACTFADCDGVWVGRADGDTLGTSLAALGDLDGDGSDDVLLGALGADGTTVDEGGVFWVDGPLSGASIVTRPSQFWYGDATNDDAGGAISGGLDFDGDGTTEFLAGAPSNDDASTNAGRVYLLSLSRGSVSMGTTSYEVYGEEKHDHLGSAVALGGDLDADGDDDALLGAYGNDENGAESGVVYIFDDALTGSVSAARADFIVRGDEHDRLAALPPTPGDVDGDGVTDLVIGGWGVDGDDLLSGAVLVFSGPFTSDWSASDADLMYGGEAGGDEAGTAFDSADVDADGVLDLLVGAPGTTSGAGAGYLMLGPLWRSSSLSAADTIVRGEAADDALGTSVAAVDVLGSSTAALFFGAPGADGGGSNSGAVYRLNGAPSGTFAGADVDAIYMGESADAEAGTTLLNLGDVDADGKDDVGAGAPGYTDATGIPGAVYVL